jgi:FMN reductase
MPSVSRTLVAVNGGLSEKSSTRRLVDLLIQSAQRQAAERGIELRVKVITLRRFARELGEGQITGHTEGELREDIESLSSADALIVASPTFKASYSGLFKAFWDLTTDGAIAGIPTLLAATGGSSRHSLMIEHHLRPLFSYLKALVLPTATFVAAEDWSTDRLAARIDRAAAELVGQLTIGSGFGADDQAAAEERAPENAVTQSAERDPFVSTAQSDLTAPVE